jgi:hypothetical protein
MAGRKRQVGVSLSDDEIAKLKAKAESEHLTMSAYVRRLLLQAIDRELLTREEHERQLHAKLLESIKKQGGGIF